MMHRTRWTSLDRDCYIIPAKWFSRWDDYVKGSGDIKGLSGAERLSPGPIDNQSLLMDSKEYYHNYSCSAAACNHILRESLEENRDYYVVSREIWEYLFNTYGGLELRRENIYISPNGKTRPDIKLEKVNSVLDIDRSRSCS